jgi:hypothetical protein
VTAAALPSSQTAARGGLKPTTATTTSRIPIPSFGGLNKVGTNGTGTTTRGRNVTTGPKKEDDLILVTKEYDALENDFRFDV